jgi:endo-beta-N-acetylglucosaminidase D
LKEEKNKMKTIDQKIEETDKLDWLYIPELEIAIQTKIHHKDKSYDDLVEEYGKEYLEENLPTDAQLQFLRNSKYRDQLSLDDTWEFVKQEDKISKEDGYVARFYADSIYAGLDCNGYSSNSDSNLGVRFVRKKKFEGGEK